MTEVERRYYLGIEVYGWRARFQNPETPRSCLETLSSGRWKWGAYASRVSFTASRRELLLA